MLTTHWDTTTGKVIFKNIVDKFYNDTLKKTTMYSPKLYKMETTNELFKKYYRWAGMAPGTSIVEGGRIPLYDPKAGSDKDIYTTEYGQGFRVSWKMKKTNQIDLVAKLTRQLTQLLLYVKDTALAFPWNNSTGTTYTCFDGFALAYASHTLMDDATTAYSNYGNVAFGLAGLEAAEYYYDTLKNDQGLVMPINPAGKVLYYHPSLHFQVTETLRTTGKVDTDVNTINYWKDRFEPYKYYHLTSTTAWGLVCPKEEDYGVLCLTLAEPRVWTKDADGTSIDSLVLGHQDFGIGLTNPKYCWIGKP